MKNLLVVIIFFLISITPVHAQTATPAPSGSPNPTCRMEAQHCGGDASCQIPGDAACSTYVCTGGFCVPPPPSNVPTRQPLPPPCAEWIIYNPDGSTRTFTLPPNQSIANTDLDNPAIKKSCKTVRTAIGAIQANPVDTIKNAFSILLGISGGIVLLLIISSGYKLITSQGDAEKVKEARETITSAVIGLLFMIFSLVILQIIGVDLLKIPGFSR